MRCGMTFAVLFVWMSLSAHAASVEELEAKGAAALASAKDGHVKLEPATPEAPYAPSEAEQKQGFVVYAPPIQRRFHGIAPSAEDVPGAAKLTLAKGETGSLLVAVYALRDLKRVTLARPAEASAQPSPWDDAVDVLPLVQAPVSIRKRVRNNGNMDAEDAKSEYRVEGLWLAESGAFDIPQGEARAFVVRVHAPPSAAGEKEIGLVLCEGGAERSTPKVSVTVRGFELADAWERGYVFGAFCAGADFGEAEFKQMKAHGIEAIQWFWGHHAMDLRKDGDRLVVDFAAFDRVVENFTKAGMRGPLVIALGNDSSGHYEKKICQLFERPMQPQEKRNKKEVKLATLDDKVTEALIVDGLRQLFQHAEERKWPEIVVMPYDEPTERLMDEHRRMVKLFREHFSKVRLYGCTMATLKLAEQLTDTDILVSNGDWKRIRALTKEKNLKSWFYGGVTCAQGYATTRVRYGLRPYASGPEGMWFWSYNYAQADPYNDFDGNVPDTAWIVAWPPLGEGGRRTECLAYEGIREGVNDVRYALTLEALLEKATGSEAAQRIAEAYAAWREGMANTEALEYRQATEGREKLAAWIEGLRGISLPR